MLFLLLFTQRFQLLWSTHRSAIFQSIQFFVILLALLPTHTIYFLFKMHTLSMKVLKRLKKRWLNHLLFLLFLFFIRWFSRALGDFIAFRWSMHWIFDVHFWLKLWWKSHQRWIVLILLFIKLWTDFLRLLLILVLRQNRPIVCHILLRLDFIL